MTRECIDIRKESERERDRTRAGVSLIEPQRVREEAQEGE